MPTLRIRPAPAAALLWLAIVAPAPAAGLPPACAAAHDGVQLCMTGQVCTCAYDRAGSLTGRVPGWRWACDIMQTCGDDSPADIGPPAPAPWQGPLYVTPGVSPPGGQMPPLPLPR